MLFFLCTKQGQYRNIFQLGSFVLQTSELHQRKEHSVRNTKSWVPDLSIIHWSDLEWVMCLPLEGPNFYSLDKRRQQQLLLTRVFFLFIVNNFQWTGGVRALHMLSKHSTIKQYPLAPNFNFYTFLKPVTYPVDSTGVLPWTGRPCLPKQGCVSCCLDSAENLYQGFTFSVLPKTCCNQYEFTISSLAGGCVSFGVTSIYCPSTWLLAFGL